MQKDGHVIVIPTQVGIQGTQLSARGASASLMLDTGLRRYDKERAASQIRRKPLALAGSLMALAAQLLQAFPA